MDPVVIVLCFPFLLSAGYGLAFMLSRGNRDFLLGPAGFLLYVALLTVPLVTVVAARPRLPGRLLAWGDWGAVWLIVGLAVGVALWGVQVVFPGRTPVDAASKVWVGPPGSRGFAALMVPVGYIVLAEELVWRGFLLSVIGLPLSSAAFALHHYHFGMRHIVFSFLAGLVWGGLFLTAENLWPAVASHLAYNALAWRHLRRQAGQASTSSVLLSQKEDGREGNDLKGQ